ncbi:MAG TPA: hypothetical protein VJ323_14555, partial [Bryobacteraceae bacterium]|nr:hypothetical protein [Bryobacteraceae bacterium]
MSSGRRGNIAANYLATAAVCPNSSLRFFGADRRLLRAFLGNGHRQDKSPCLKHDVDLPRSTDIVG